jgi:cobalt-zinc-cadmium efflux system membrane fusion protein
LERATTARMVRVAPGLVESGRIRTVRATRRAPKGAVRLPAEIVASPEGAAETGTLLAGRIARFEFREGDRVKRGQVLAWVDAPEAARAVSDLIRARARTETQSRKVKRLEGLVASEAAAQVALDDARLELELARADLAAARTL